MQQVPGLEKETMSETEFENRVVQVISRMKEQDEERKQFKALKNELAEAKVKFCSPEGLCFKDQASLDKYMAEKEEAKKKTEDEKLAVVPALETLDEEKRKIMSEPEKIARRQKFQHVIDLAGGSFVDAYNMVRHSPRDYTVLRRRVIDSMSDSELQQAFMRCVGDECKPLRTNLIERGYRIQKKDEERDRWESMPVEEEEKEKVEEHF